MQCGDLGALEFDDFLFMILPQHKYRKLMPKKLEGKTDYNDSPTPLSEETCCILAEIFANYLQFYMERELIVSRLHQAGFSVTDLFSKICQSQSGLSS